MKKVKLLSLKMMLFWCTIKPLVDEKLFNEAATTWLISSFLLLDVCMGDKSLEFISRSY